jgi:predicted RNase H-like HicB family nuclease
MLRRYIDAAMKKASYEILKDDNSFYGEIKGFDGVYANADTLEECRVELEEVLEEWLLVCIARNIEVPIVDGLELRIREVA